MNRKKKINAPILFGIILVGAFVLWNLAWVINLSRNYIPYRNALNKSESGAYILEDNGYTYSIKLPDYLSFTGNMAVGKIDSQDTLIIWPSGIGEPVYGVRLSVTEDQRENVFSRYEMYVDKNGELVADKNSADALVIWEQKKESIREMLEACRNIWDL